MQFNSYMFIFAFMPLAVLLFFLSARFSKRSADIALFILSLGFYAYGGLKSLLVVAVDTAFNLLMVKLLQRSQKKIILFFTVIMNVAAFLVFRPYIGVLGISFISFQLIAFAVETYKGNIKENDDWHLLDYLTYVLYFPKIVAGPIVHPKEFISQLHDEKRYKADPDNIASGFILFTIGAFKKVLIADTFARSVAWGFQNLEAATAMDMVFVAISYFVQVYFDFSGYCDMAGGVSRMLNLELPINFNSPLKSVSIADFWRRWHVSLTGFLRDYIYIPLGGNRKGTLRTCINIMLIFLASGIWHGQTWNYVIWGAINGGLSIIYRYISKWYDRLHMALRWIITFSAIAISSLLVRCESFSQWLTIVKKIVLIEDMNVSEGLCKSVFLVETEPLLEAAHLGMFIYRPIRFFLLFYIVTIAICLGAENAYSRKFRFSIPMIIFCSILFITVAISLGGEMSFVYQRF